MYSVARRLLFPTSPIAAIITATLAGVGSFSRLNGKSLNPFSPSAFTALLQALGIALASVAALSILQKILLRSLLTYHGCFFDPASKKTVLWALAMKFLFAKSTETFAYQDYLPHLPVPEIKDSLNRYLVSIEPLLNSSEMETLRQRAQEFVKSEEAEIIQRVLLTKYQNSNNYVDEWWLQFAYLRQRSSIMISSNYCAMTLDMKPLTKRPAARAAFYLHRFIKTTFEVVDGKIPAMMSNYTPMCMNQYRKILSLTRIPGVESDTLVAYDNEKSRHVVVIRNNQYFKVEVYGRATNQPGSAYKLIPPSQMELAFESAIKQADNEKSTSAVGVAQLTGWNRTSWARVREEYFLKDETNATALEAIESAIMVISFDDIEIPWDDLDAIEASTLHGGVDGKLPRWYDKSLTMCVTNNAVLTFNVEHSFADGAAVAHFLDQIMASECQDHPYELGLDDGRVSAKIGSHPGTITGVAPPQRLNFNLANSGLTAAISQATEDVAKAANDIDIKVKRFQGFGKEVISKECKVSPDGFVQAALQVAWYRNQNKTFTQTYESAMTRFFADGRTETIRSCTNQMTAFVRAFDEGTWKESEAEKLNVAKLLKKATENHQYLTLLAMTGSGVDRHLFCLYIASFGVSSGGAGNAFLRDVVSRGWKLSTSQTPVAQSSLWKGGRADQKTYPRANGGFGFAHDEGYGVSYALPADDRIYAHVTSKKSCKTTDSEKFYNEFAKAMTEMRQLLSMNNKA
jgi:carnitine O-palmitoyltransferase 1, liver isoform